MAIIGFEGFDNWISGNTSTLYNNSAGGSFLWTFFQPTSLPAGTLSGKKMLCGNGGTTAVQISTSTSLVVGCRWQAVTVITNGRDIYLFRDSANANQCGLSVNSTGKLIVWRGTTATVLGTGTTTLSPDVDYFIEIKLGFSNSANVQVNLNAVSEITLSGVDTTNTANQNCGFIVFQSAVGTSTSHAWDDLYVLDTSGSSPLNDFLGIVRIETLYGSANDSVTWTPNASTNVSRINETTLDSDTTYNSSSTSTDIDTFSHASLSSTPSQIFAVKVQSFARKDDVAVRTFRNKLKSGATTVNGTSKVTTTVYQMWEDYYATDPDTTVAWTASGANATKIGYENV